MATIDVLAKMQRLKIRFVVSSLLATLKLVLDVEFSLSGSKDAVT
jgi:hypothetical protein